MNSSTTTTNKFLSIIPPDGTTPIVESDVLGKTVTFDDVVNDSFESWQPVIPTSVVRHIMGTAGCKVNDENVLKLIALEVQHHVTSIIKEAQQTRFARNISTQGSNSTATTNTTTTTNTSGNTSSSTKSKLDDKKSNQQDSLQHHQQNVLTVDDVAFIMEKYGYVPIKTPYFVAE
jgi:hypothetical protein